MTSFVSAFGCNTVKKPTVFTRVSAFNDWIEEVSRTGQAARAPADPDPRRSVVGVGHMPEGFEDVFCYSVALRISRASGWSFELLLNFLFSTSVYEVPPLVQVFSCHGG